MSRSRSGNLAADAARFICGTTTPPAATLERAKLVIADTFSANLAGASSDVVPVLRSYIATSGGKGDKIVLGTDIRTTAELAALANGTMSAALEFDDVLSIMPGHPSAVVMGALLADAAALNKSGAEVACAYAVGVQAGARIAQAMTLDHYKRGFHVTGTIAMFSGVAGLARVRGMNEEDTVRAIGIAASFAGGIQGNFGTMTKPLHSGWAARNALAAVNLAQAGLTASQQVFETEGGFFDAYGSEDSNASRVAGLMDGLWIFDEPGVTLKLFPCCYASHRGMDAVQSIMARLNIAAADVERVVCFAPPGGLIPLKFPRPATHFESLFSLPYALAVTVLDGHPGLRSFSQARVASPDVAAMLERISVTESRACVADYPGYDKDSYGSRGEVHVQVFASDGRSGSERVRIAPGHPQRQMTWDQARAKFNGCAAVAGFEPAAAEAIFNRILHLEQQTRFGDLAETMAL